MEVMPDAGMNVQRGHDQVAPHGKRHRRKDHMEIKPKSDEFT